MDRKKVYYIIEWVVALAACGWLVWKLATYDDYAGLWEAFRSMDCARVCAFLICIALMPVNMSIEAWRWRTLLPMSWRDAHYQVYYSKLAGLITPWRLGEYPSRAILMAQASQESGVKSQESIWARVLSMGAVGSATMTMAIIAAGLAAMMISNLRFKIYDLGFSYIIAVSIFLILLGVALYLAPRSLRRWATVSHKLILISTVQSLVRLACWCVQLALIIFALDGLEDLEFLEFLEGLSKCAIYYLLVTITPNVPIAEVGVRGFWAMALFGTMNATLAGVLLWAINTLLPCGVWFFIKKPLNS